MMNIEPFAVQGPYNLALSLRVRDSLTPEPPHDPGVFQEAVRIDGSPVLLEVRQVQTDPPRLQLEAGSSPIADRLRGLAEWMLFADLDLQPFYGTAESHPVVAGLVHRLSGLKPTRPATLFEMAVIAVTEQQISMTAAYHIRQRLIERFGDPVEGLWAFPTPESLAGASLEELVSCGLSARKAEYLHGLALAVTEGALDLEALKGLPDDDVRTIITQLRGFGRWSAEYILVRGLGRPDALPADDLGVRTVVGRYLGDGGRMTAVELEAALDPFSPYRGLAAYYLVAAARLRL